MALDPVRSRHSWPWVTLSSSSSVPRHTGLLSGPHTCCVCFHHRTTVCAVLTPSFPGGLLFILHMQLNDSFFTKFFPTPQPNSGLSHSLMISLCMLIMIIELISISSDFYCIIDLEQCHLALNKYLLNEKMKKYTISENRTCFLRRKSIPSEILGKKTFDV
jgi:hypothetical protein